MDAPVTPDPDAAATPQRRLASPLDFNINDLPAMRQAMMGVPTVIPNNEARSFSAAPIPPMAPLPRVQICNRDGEVLHELDAVEIQFNIARPVLPYYDEVSALSAQRAAAEQRQRDHAARLAQERADRAAARARAEALLLSLLTPGQRRAYGETRTIPVRGSDKRRYRLEYGTAGNVTERNRAGQEIASWCAAPAGNLPTEDVLAAQLLWLRTDAPGFRAVANADRSYPDPPLRRSSAAYRLRPATRQRNRDGGCGCPICREQRAGRGRHADPAPTPRLTADPLPGMEPGRITRMVYDYGRVSG